MIKLITLLVSLSLIGLIESNPIPEDPSVDWSTRISDNVDSLIAPTKFNFDDSSEEIDSTFAKREASPISGPLDAPLGWGARIESSPSTVGSDVSPSSSSSGTGAVVSGGVGGGGGGSAGVIGGDNKQKVDWALNPGDNKKLYSSNDNPDVIEQKKEETLPLASDSSKPSEESNPDPYKNILPAVLTGKRRLAEGDKPVQSSPSSSSSSSPSLVSSEGYASPSTVNDSKEKVTSQIESKGQSVGQVLPYDGPYHLKPNEGKSIPQHVYTEDQFPSVITIKGREYLVIPHKSNTVRPSAAQTSPGSPWYSIPVQGQFVQSGQFGSQFFNPNSPTAPHQPTQTGHESKSNQSFPPVAQPTVAEVPSGGHHHQFVSSPFTGGYPGQSSYEFGHPSFPQHPGSSRFTWSSRYPVYHSSVFTNPNVQQSGPSAGQFSENSIPSVFSSFFPQYGQYPSSSLSPSSSPVIKNFEFFTPPSHTVSVSSTGSSSSSSSSGSSVAASPQGEVKDNPTFIPDPSFSPKLQDSFQSSPSVVGNGGGGGGGGVIINTQQESFVTKQPIKPESNLHAPPQIPTWNPFGFSVVAGSYPIQSPSPSVSVSTSSSSSSVSSSSPSSPTSSPSSTSSKTHAESPVTVTVDTKFPPPRSPSSSSSSGNNGVKGGSPSIESSSPSITVGSFNVDSAADQPVAKGQPQSQPKPQQTQQQDQQQVGVAGETLVPTTILHDKNQFLPNRPFLSSSGYFVSSSSPPVNQSPSSIYSTSPTSVSPSSPTPGSIPQLGGFHDQRHFLSQPWQQSSSSSSSGYNYPIPASPPSPYFDQVNPVPTPSWDYPFYHQFQQENFYNQRSGGLDQPDFDLNQIPSAKIFRSPAFAN